jgi:DNA-binding transcriptional LysR family regulator
MGKAVADPGLDETRALIAVIEQRNFARAAKQLNISPSRISGIISELEARLGVRLVERTTRSVAPTEAGEQLVGRLRPLISEYQAAFESINDFRSKPAGVLRLTVAPPVLDMLHAEMLARFLEEFPDISVDISIDGSITDIVAGRFDAAIRPGDMLERDMIAVRVSDEIRTVVVGSPSYLAAHGTPETPQELAQHNCIRIRPPNGGLFPWRFEAEHRTIEIRIEGNLIVNENRLAVGAVTAGVGLMQTPIASVAAELDASRLVTILEEWEPAPIEGFFLCYPSRRQNRAALRALVDFLRRQQRGADKRKVHPSPPRMPEGQSDAVGIRDPLLRLFPAMSDILAIS